MLTESYIDAQLKSFYPNSLKITTAIVSEIARRAEHSGWDVTTFDDALAEYRERDKNYRWPPEWRTLKNYGSGNLGGEKLKNIMINTFINTCVNHGWEFAVQESWALRIGGDRRQCEFLRDLLDDRGIRPTGEKYIGISQWLKQFLIILHDEKKPADAFLWASHNAPRNRSWYEARYEFFNLFVLEKQQSYFRSWKLDRTKTMAKRIIQMREGKTLKQKANEQVRAVLK